VGLSFITAVEILAHPRDLSIHVFERDDRYGFCITRGPGHAFKPLLTVGQCKTLHDALHEAKRLLQSIATNEELKNWEPAKLFRDTNEASGLLTSEIVDRIISDLRTHRSAATYQY
jgi:hypothetical protein